MSSTASGSWAVMFKLDGGCCWQEHAAGAASAADTSSREREPTSTAPTGRGRAGPAESIRTASTSSRPRREGATASGSASVVTISGRGNARAVSGYAGSAASAGSTRACFAHGAATSTSSLSASSRVIRAWQRFLVGPDRFWRSARALIAARREGRGGASFATAPAECRAKTSWIRERWALMVRGDRPGL